MFTAIVPPADVLDDLDRFLEPRRDAGTGLRWTGPDQWHLTLAFMPDVLDRAYDELVERLTRAAARRSAVRLRLADAGAFPHAAKAKVLWLGPQSESVEGLQRLATGARSAAVKSGVEVDGQRFKPHVTVARTRVPGDVTRWLRVLGAYESASWVASEFALIASHLGEGPRRRPRHEVVETFALREPPREVDRDGLGLSTADRTGQ